MWHKCRASEMHMVWVRKPEGKTLCGGHMHRWDVNIEVGPNI